MVNQSFSANKPRPTTPLDAIKFICKDLWILLYRKQIDNLKTNHRGVFVLTDQRFQPLSRMSVDRKAGSGPGGKRDKAIEEAMERAQTVSLHLCPLSGASGEVKGRLGADLDTTLVPLLPVWHRARSFGGTGGRGHGGRQHGGNTHCHVSDQDQGSQDIVTRKQVIVGSGEQCHRVRSQLSKRSGRNGVRTKCSRHHTIDIRRYSPRTLHGLEEKCQKTCGQTHVCKLFGYITAMHRLRPLSIEWCREPNATSPAGCVTVEMSKST